MDGEISFNYAEDSKVPKGAVVCSVKDKGVTDDIESEIKKIDKDILNAQKTRIDLSKNKEELDKIESEISVSIDNAVYKDVYKRQAMDCYGIVGMAAKNMKDGLFQLLKVASLTKGIKVYVNDEDGTLSLDFHIIVEYGTNISAIADNIINTVKFKIEDCFDIKTDKINVFVEGVRVDS